MMADFLGSRLEESRSKIFFFRYVPLLVSAVLSLDYIFVLFRKSGKMGKYKLTKTK